MEKDSRFDSLTGNVEVHNIHQAKMHLERLVNKVARERVTVVITKDGRPTAKIVAFEAQPKGKRRGFLAGYGFVFDAAAFGSQDAEMADRFLGNA